MNNKKMNDDFDRAFEDFLRVSKKLDKMLANEYMKTCSAYKGTNGLSCIDCLDNSEGDN